MTFRVEYHRQDTEPVIISQGMEREEALSLVENLFVQGNFDGKRYVKVALHIYQAESYTSAAPTRVLIRRES